MIKTITHEVKKEHYIKILLIVLIVFVERLNLHIIIYLNVRNILVSEIVFFESYCSYWTFDLRKIYYYLAVQTWISIQILLFLRQCITIFRKVNDFYKIHKTQIHHVIFYLECNLQFPFFSSPGPKVHVNYCHHLASVVCRL